MKNPSNPPEDNLHECDRSGLRPVYVGNLGFGSDEDVQSSIAEEAANRVLFAVVRISYGLSRKVEAIAKENMPADAYLEYERFVGVLDDLRVRERIMVMDVISRLMIHFSTGSRTLEQMVIDTLMASGFCCEDLVDEYVREHVPFNLPSLPGYQSEWLSLGYHLRRGSIPWSPQEA